MTVEDYNKLFEEAQKLPDIELADFPMELKTRIDFDEPYQPIFADDRSSNEATAFAVSVNRAFQVTVSPLTLFFLCDKHSGDVSILNPVLIAFFVPSILGTSVSADTSPDANGHFGASDRTRR